MRALSMIVALVMVLSIAQPGLAAAPSVDLRTHIDRIVKILQDPAFGNRPAERRREIQTIATDIFDFEETAKLSLGRHWQARTPAERAEFVQLFSALIQASYLSKVEGYEGEKIQYTGDSVDGDQAAVHTTVITRKGTEIPIDYRMHRKDDRWRVYDVVIEGMSLVGNYRTQFNKIIQTSSYQDLVAKLRARAAASSGTATAKEHHG